MLLEIQIAVSFLTSYLYNKLPRRRVDLFSVELARQLKEKFEGHWYPERPSKGSGYRCLLIGDDLDPVLMNAANDNGLSIEEIRASLPEKLTMWIDPDEVSYRIEEQPVVKMIYQKDKYGEQENLAELEGISGQQQHYGMTATSPRRNSKTVEQVFHRSPVQTSPASQTSPLSVHSPIHANYSLWSTTQETVPTQAEVDSRLSPNAQEFTYPVSKQSPSTDYLYRQDTSSLNSYARNLWGSAGEAIDRRQSLSSLQSLYGWLNIDSTSYKPNYNSSQLEIMA